MTDIDHEPLWPEPPLQEEAPRYGRKRSFAWRRSLALLGVLAGGIVIGAGGFAVAAAGIDQLGWKQGARLAIVQHVVAHALDSVGANAAQEAKAHDIIAMKFAEVAPDPAQHDAMRKQALDLIGAPTIDRAAVEKLRADAVASIDAKSKSVVAGVLDIADLLTPPQRAQLAVEIEAMAQQHGPMMGPWGGMHGHSMDDGPDGGSDKD
ncbi:Spy/CpxP family protein refolding chaperone [Methylocapsa sp. S129]|uniref:Spy/CpxP family protein refolding chaperone n=1 Tax=Methylocapsa sp. S129 TaxID=1641869 RepID=UPI00131E0007|nr:Spy/CpxP family protein refolding chaperone [Methylocapsa sp. S129]